MQKLPIIESFARKLSSHVNIESTAFCIQCDKILFYYCRKMCLFFNGCLFWRFSTKIWSKSVLAPLHLLPSAFTFLIFGTSFQNKSPCQVIGTWSGAIIRREFRLQGRCHNLDWYWRILSFRNFGKRLSIVIGFFCRWRVADPLLTLPGALSFERNSCGILFGAHLRNEITQHVRCLWLQPCVSLFWWRNPIERASHCCLNPARGSHVKPDIRYK